MKHIMIFLNALILLLISIDNANCNTSNIDFNLIMGKFFEECKIRVSPIKCQSLLISFLKLRPFILLDEHNLDKRVADPLRRMAGIIRVKV